MPTTGDTAEEAFQKLAAAAGPGFDRSKMDELKRKLGRLPTSEKQTPSGSEAPPQEVPVPEPTDGRPLTGRDVDWNEYDLDFNVAHLYKRAVFRDTPQGPKWVTIVPDFHSTVKDFRNHGKRVNVPGSMDKSETEPMNVAEYLNDMCNGREAWKISALMPVGMQCGILLEREVPLILPDPVPLKKTEEVEAPDDPALQSVEDAALAFVDEQGEKALDTEPSVEEDTSASTPETNIGLRAVEDPAEVEAIRESLVGGAVPARSSDTVAKALAIAAPETVEAPTAGVVQPEGVANPLIGGQKVPAAGYSAAQDLLRALNDPEFRKNLPSE